MNGWNEINKLVPSQRRTEVVRPTGDGGPTKLLSDVASLTKNVCNKIQEVFQSERQRRHKASFIIRGGYASGKTTAIKCISDEMSKTEIVPTRNIWFLHLDRYSTWESIFQFFALKAKEWEMRDTYSVLNKADINRDMKLKAARNVLLHCRLLILDDFDQVSEDIDINSLISDDDYANDEYLVVLASCDSNSVIKIYEEKNPPWIFEIPDCKFSSVAEIAEHTQLSNLPQLMDMDLLLTLANFLGSFFASVVSKSIDCGLVSASDLVSRLRSMSDANRSSRNELIEATMLGVITVLSQQDRQMLFSIASVRMPLPIKSDASFKYLQTLGLVFKQNNANHDFIGMPDCVRIIVQNITCHNFLQQYVDGHPTALDLWKEVLPVRLINLLSDAENHVWPFIPEMWQYKDKIDVNQSYNLKDIIHRTNEYSDLKEIDILQECLHSALMIGNYEAAASLVFLMDRFTYWQGTSKGTISIAAYIRRNSKTTAIAPQVIVREARLKKNEGDLQGAEKILSTLIQNEKQIGRWKYQKASDYDLISSVCIQIKGDIFRALGLWVEAAKYLIKSIIGFRGLPKVDTKGWASSLSLLADCFQYMSLNDFLNHMTSQFELHGNHPLLEAISCVEEAARLSIFSPLFYSKNKVVFLERCFCRMTSLAKGHFHADKIRVARSQRKDAGRITRSRMARPHEDGASVNIQNVMEGLPDLKEKMLRRGGELAFLYAQLLPVDSIEKINYLLYSAAECIEGLRCHMSIASLESREQYYEFVFCVYKLARVCEELSQYHHHYYGNEITVSKSMSDALSCISFHLYEHYCSSEKKFQHTEWSSLLVQTTLQLLRLPRIPHMEKAVIPPSSAENTRSKETKQKENEEDLVKMKSHFRTTDADLTDVKMTSSLVDKSSPQAKIFKSQSISNEATVATEEDVGKEIDANSTAYDIRMAETEQTFDDKDRQFSEFPDIGMRDSQTTVGTKEEEAFYQVSTVDDDEIDEDRYRLELTEDDPVSDGTSDIPKLSFLSDKAGRDKEGSVLEAMRNLSTAELDGVSSSEGVKTIGQMRIEQTVTVDITKMSKDAERRLQATMGTLEDSSTLEGQLNDMEQTLNIITHAKKERVHNAKVWRYDPLTRNWSASESLAFVGELLQLAKDKEGNCRDAYMFEYITQEEPMSKYLGKQYKKLDKYRNKITIQQYRQDIICQVTSRYYVTRFNQQLYRKGLSFGQVQFLPAVLIELTDVEDQFERYFNVEPYMFGNFTRITNNWTFVNPGDVHGKDLLLAFSHFSFCSSKGKLIIVDIQGWTSEDESGATFLTDPQIHTRDKKGFGTANRGLEGFRLFFVSQHSKCNEICKALKLARPVL
eukprot:gene9178-10152_t